MAIAGFILALVGLFINPYGIPSLLGIIFSSLGFTRDNKKGLAIAGLIIGIIGFIYTLLVILGVFNINLMI